MTKDEALKLALEALEPEPYLAEWYVNEHVIPAAIAAIKTALANVPASDTSQERVDETTKQRHEQEPVAFYVYKPTLPRGHLGNVSDGGLPWVYDQDPSSGYSARMLVYTTPPAQLEQGSCGNCNGSGRMPRDPDIGTDQECFVCDGTGKLPKEPEQEPFCWCIESQDSADWCFAKTEEGVISNSVFIDEEHGKLTEPFPLYTTPPQRKPLTDEELRAIENKINPNMRWRSSDEEGITFYPSEYYELIQAIEAAHGIKGEA